ncbi:MAG: protein jag [Chloroflexi bacterium]|nr:protein jag [Chloroflexota bacterium]
MSASIRIEVRAKTVDEAIRLALAQLNRRRDEVEVEVLREPTGGIFGFGAEEALVRVSAAARAEDQAADDDEDEYDDEDDEYDDEMDEEDAVVEEVTDEEEDEDEYDEEDEEDVGSAVAVADDPAQRQIDAVAQETVQEMLTHMGIAARVTLRDRRHLYLSPDDPPTSALDVQGNNLGVLIGRKGETLVALQYVANLIVNRRTDQWTRVLVDVGGYRRRREESLEGLAQRVAYRVVQSNRPVTLEPMPANERRVIHMALKDHGQVITESSGEGEQRKVTISPRLRGR